MSVSTLSLPHSIPSNSSRLRLRHPNQVVAAIVGRARAPTPPQARRPALRRTPRCTMIRGQQRDVGADEDRARRIRRRSSSVRDRGEHPRAEIAVALRTSRTSRTSAPSVRAISASASSGVKKIVTSGTTGRARAACRRASRAAAPPGARGDRCGARRVLPPEDGARAITPTATLTARGHATARGTAVACRARLQYTRAPSSTATTAA